MGKLKFENDPVPGTGAFESTDATEAVREEKLRLIKSNCECKFWIYCRAKFTWN